MEFLDFLANVIDLSTSVCHENEVRLDTITGNCSAQTTTQTWAKHKNTNMETMGNLTGIKISKNKR